MANPQQPELRRSGRTPLTPDEANTAVEVEHRAPAGEPGAGPVPPENQPGHHPDQEQDQPDLDDLAARFGIRHDPEGDGGDEPTSASAPRSSGRDRSPSIGRTAFSVAETVVATGVTVGIKVATPVVRWAGGAVRRAADTARRR